MPRGDGTGPMGMGPVTGRGAGFCAGFTAPGYANSAGGFGREEDLDGCFVLPACQDGCTVETRMKKGHILHQMLMKRSSLKIRLNFLKAGLTV